MQRGTARVVFTTDDQGSYVDEITISLNFDQLLQSIDMLASDLDTRSSTQVPTFRVAQMTVAGKG